MSSVNFVDMDDHEEIKNNKLNKWKLYGLGGILIILYSSNLIIQSKPEYVKKLWIVYIIISAVLGFIS
jgi:hypothetical protein